MTNAYFKYISDINAVERLTQLLGGRIYFTSADNFNDPFEFSACTIGMRNYTKIQAAKHGNRKKQQSLSRKQKIASRREARDGINLVEHHKLQNRWINEFGIYCVSKNPTNLLMWSHYANCHKGICIGFDAQKTIFKQARKIDYTETLPKLNRDDSPEDLLDKIALTKSKDWSYEEEYRILSRPIRNDEKNFYTKHIEKNSDSKEQVADLLSKNGGPGLHEFDQGSIFVIYIGIKATIEMEEKIREIASFYDITVVRLQKDPTSFSLY